MGTRDTYVLGHLLSVTTISYKVILLSSNTRPLQSFMSEYQRLYPKHVTFDLIYMGFLWTYVRRHGKNCCTKNRLCCTKNQLCLKIL